MIKLRTPLLVLLLAALAGCTTAPPAPTAIPATPAVEPAAAVAAWYQQAQATGHRVLTIDASQSLIVIIAHRGGSLARLGHDHAVASRTINGLVAPDDGRADFQFRLDQMTVDEDVLRTEAGFTTQPSSDAIAGTRRNMLTTVLEAERFPVVQLHVERINGESDAVRLTITLHGVTRSMDVPATIAMQGESLTASGSFTLRQTDFGITPMSVMGGAIAVEDQLDLRFRLTASRTMQP